MDDYYIRSSSRQYLPNIRTPTLIIQSRDDPFLPESALPQAKELSGAVTLELSRHGGHVGFVSGSTPLRPCHWLEKRVIQHLASIT